MLSSITVFGFNYTISLNESTHNYSFLCVYIYHLHVIDEWEYKISSQWIIKKNLHFHNQFM